MHEIRRSELRTAYFNARPSRRGPTYVKNGVKFGPPSRHTGLDAVVRLIARELGVEIRIVED